MKICKKCKTKKDLTDFYKHPSSKDGRRIICRRCISEKSALEYKKNPTKRIATSIEWNKNNSERRLQIQRNWYNRNKKQVSEYYFRTKVHKKKITKLDPLYLEKKNIRWHKRRAKLKGSGGSHTIKEWEEAKVKYNNKCAICKKKKKLTKDHIIPITKEGTDYISNIQPLCSTCNIKKGNKLNYEHKRTN